MQPHSTEQSQVIDSTTDPEEEAGYILDSDSSSPVEPLIQPDPFCIPDDPEPVDDSARKTAKSDLLKLLSTVPAPAPSSKQEDEPEKEKEDTKVSHDQKQKTVEEEFDDIFY